MPWMNFTDEQVKAVRIAVEWYVHDSNVAHRRIYPALGPVRDLINQTYEMSLSRHETGGGTDHPEHSRWIGTTRVVQILGWSERKVQRLKERLGGEKVGGRLIFPEHVVLDYREERHA